VFGWSIKSALDAAPNVLRARTLTALRRGCPECVFDIGAMTLDMRAGRLAASNIHFVCDRKSHVRIDVRSENAVVDLDMRSLFSPILHIRHITLDGVSATLTQDVDPNAWGPVARTLPPPSPSPLLRLPVATLDGVDIRHASLTYTDQIASSVASVAFTGLDVHVSPIATRRGFVPPMTTLTARGTLAGSGAATMALALDPLASELDLTLQLGLNGQDLAPLGSYAVPAEGLHLQGRIDRATATLHYAHGRVGGNVSGTFRGLDVHFEPTARRDLITTGVANLVATVEIARSNDSEPADQTRMNIDRARQPDEPLVGFLWFALRDACIDLARHGRHDDESINAVDEPSYDVAVR
jgi:hypothetical protein